MRAEYRVACGSELAELEEKVNNLVALGFVLAGSMQIKQRWGMYSEVKFYQPMYRPVGYVSLSKGESHG